MYDITLYSRQKAKELNVVIKPSTNKQKKLDVYKNDKKIATIGDVNYSDYGTYIKSHGKEYADRRRALYHTRHKTDNGVNGYYANKILW